MEEGAQVTGETAAGGRAQGRSSERSSPRQRTPWLTGGYWKPVQCSTAYSKPNELYLHNAHSHILDCTLYMYVVTVPIHFLPLVKPFYLFIFILRLPTGQSKITDEVYK